MRPTVAGGAGKPSLRIVALAASVCTAVVACDAAITRWLCENLPAGAGVAERALAVAGPSLAIFLLATAVAGFTRRGRMF